jgi:hypothetical protein
MPTDANVALTGTRLTHSNAARAAPERRLIVVAQGKQFHNAELPEIWRIPDALMLSGPDRIASLERTIAGWRQSLNSRKPGSTATPAQKASWNEQKKKLDHDIAKFRKWNAPLKDHQKVDLQETRPGSKVWTFFDSKQGVRFDLRVVNTKKEFLRYLCKSKDLCEKNGGLFGSTRCVRRSCSIWPGAVLRNCRPQRIHGSPR